MIVHFYPVAEGFCEAVGIKGGGHDCEQQFFGKHGKPLKKMRFVPAERAFAIARELLATVKGKVTVDWTLRENVRAELLVAVQRILRKYGYPTYLQATATDTVIEEAETLSEGWAVA